MSLTVSPKVGHSDIAVAEFLDHAIVLEITPADLVSNVYRYSLPYGSIVAYIRSLIITAFNTATTVKVGDSTDDDGYFVTTDIDITSVGNMKNSLLAGPEDGVSGVTTPAAFAEGKAYPTSAGLLVVTFNGTPTVGKLRLDVVLAGKDLAAKPADMINNW